jgi:hypothetical protein
MRGDAIITEEELRDTHLMPYKELVVVATKSIYFIYLNMIIL